MKSSRNAQRLPDFLPWESLAADGTVRTRTGLSVAFWAMQFPDTSVSQSEADALSEKVAGLFKRSETGPSYWFMLNRRPQNIAADQASGGWMSAADAEIESHRLAMFCDAEKNSVNDWYAACAMGSPKEGILDAAGAEDVFSAFEQTLRICNARPVRLGCEPRQGAPDTLSLLKTLCSTETWSLKCPMEGFAGGVSEYLCTEAMDLGSPLRLGTSYIKALTVHAFPGSTYSNMLFTLQTMGFCFRWTTRWIPQCNRDSQKTAKNLRSGFKSGTKSWKTALYENSTGRETDTFEAQAVTDTAEMEQTLESLTHGETLGQLTSTVLLMSRSPEMLEAQAGKVKEVLHNQGFDAIDENDSNIFQAWLGTMPGDVRHNLRKPYVTASNFSQILPLTNIYHGAGTNFYLRSICGNGHPLCVGKLLTNELYFLNLNGPSDDVGHTFIIGSTGGGKSVLLALLASQWMRYPRSRVILFDKDMSFANICRRTGGAIYVPGAEDSKLQFMPLGRIREKPSQSVGWLETAISASGTAVTPEITKELSSVCRLWDLSVPTLERFVMRLRGFSPDSPALPPLERILEDAEMSNLFGGEEDTFGKDSFRRKTMIEMGPLMNMGDQAVLPALGFMFDRMDELFDADPQPTLLVMDEAWKFLAHPVFRKKIKEWLKTLRKKKVFVLFALQNISDIDDAEEFLTSCHTRIFLPNPDIGENGAEGVKDCYRRLGLTESEMSVIALAQRKAQYFVSQQEGSALVDFCVDSYQLERLARDGA